ncbi:MULTISPECIES: type IV pilus modification protein PilV [unclassified Shewanella]|uniref:type IV pilus modification protein PilV n=1 Tax=unclassified Shewanella TaxID=196818 RepID=UPI001BC2F9CC|nr:MULTISPECIES: type IV pilus modification protein PilV [unclassified Shewanella]GIU08962.1 type IV pilus modification protein PilV [Shewanella sp. MBTL60-112-B1]GIU28763.1 type IV pilus modification protein PilV [Shewanella sp. MBTL60-112-B2]
MQIRENGLSLIEVLVALVILTVGLIGVFNLHVVSKRGSFESFQQTLAAYSANDIVNRLRLNQTQKVAYSGEYTGTLNKPGKSCDVAVNANVTCSNSETLAWDIYQWKLLMDGLDDATGCIEAKANGDVAIAITWRGIQETSDGAANRTSFVKGCGMESNRRRVYLLETVIL